MEQKKKNIVIVSLINFIKGIIFGGTILVPGVSGGTTALIIGLYEDLIGSVNNLFKGKKQFIKSVIFLIPVGLGALVGVFALMKILSLAVKNFSLPTNMFFAGLVLGSIPYILYLIYPGLFNRKKKAGGGFGAVNNTDKNNTYKDKETAFAEKPADKNGFKAWHIIPFVLAAALVITMAFLSPQDRTIETLTVRQYVFLPIAGFIAAVAMIVPGVSGSFTLQLMGFYWLILEAADTMNILVLGLFALGALLGVVAAAKIIGFLFKRLKTVTYLAILGLVAACAAAIFIDKGTYVSGTGIWGIVTGAALMIIGLAAAAFFGVLTMRADGKKAAADEKAVLQVVPEQAQTEGGTDN